MVCPQTSNQCAVYPGNILPSSSLKFRKMAAGKVAGVFLLVTVVGMTKVDAAATNDIHSWLRIGPNIDVTLSDLEDVWFHQNQVGAVNGHRSCGGPGKLLGMRYATCSGDPDTLCQVPADDRTRLAELYFVPSQDIYSVGIRITVSARGVPPTVIFDKVLENSEIYQGEKYSMNAEVGASPMFKGRQVTLRFEVYNNVNDKATEICSEADFDIVKNQ